MDPRDLKRKLDRVLREAERELERQDRVFLTEVATAEELHTKWKNYATELKKKRSVNIGMNGLRG